VSVRLTHVRGRPTLTIRARKRNDDARLLKTLRVVMPSRLAVGSSALIRRNVRVTAGGRRLARSAWSLSRSGVLTVRAPGSGRSNINVTITRGAVRASRTLRRLALRRRALPRLTFSTRVTDAADTRFNATVRVRPSR
jgi:hypothetical protein